MSVKVMTAVFERYPVGGGEMLLALALADHASDDGTRVYPSVKALAEKTRQAAYKAGPGIVVLGSEASRRDADKRFGMRWSRI